MTKYSWDDDLQNIVDEYGSFGHNTEFDIKPFLKKIEKFGATVTIVDYYTIRIQMPAIARNMDRENLLLHVLTNTPLPSESFYNGKKDQLTLEWHF